MAELNEQVKDALAQSMLDEMSSRWEIVPVAHQQIRAGITIFDQQLEAAELAILGALPSSVADWLTAHPTIAREFVIAVAQARKENL